jgi:hypothetical protein
MLNIGMKSWGHYERLRQTAEVLNEQPNVLGECDGIRDQRTLSILSNPDPNSKPPNLRHLKPPTSPGGAILEYGPTERGHRSRGTASSNPFPSREECGANSQTRLSQSMMTSALDCSPADAESKYPPPIVAATPLSFEANQRTVFDGFTCTKQ